MSSTHFVPYLRCLYHSLNKIDVLEAELKDEFDFDKPSPKVWAIAVNRDGKLDFPEELLRLAGWSTGDDVEWFEIGDDEFLLVKIEPQ